MRNRQFARDLPVYVLAAVFFIAGVLVLAGGDASIPRTRTIQYPVDIVGDERHLFGAVLLAIGYVLLRWAFREPDEVRHLTVELRIVGLLAALGYLAYCIGG